MELVLVKSATALLLPPSGNLLLMLLGWLVARRSPRVGRALIWAGAVTLLLLTQAHVSRPLVHSLERYPPASIEALRAAAPEAIVVLGGGRNARAPEYGGRDTVSEAALVRIRYGAYLHKALGLPVLVTGGRIGPAPVSEAQVLADALQESFGTQVRWLEEQAQNTAENALYSARMLKADGVHRIILVTHAMHMWRSVRQFRAQGLEVLPAGTDFVTEPYGGMGPTDFVPSAGALVGARAALHEYLGMVWYAIRY